MLEAAESLSGGWGLRHNWPASARRRTLLGSELECETALRAPHLPACHACSVMDTNRGPGALSPHGELIAPLHIWSLVDEVATSKVSILHACHISHIV